MIETPIQKVLPKLKGVTGRKPQWSARCPTHDDKRASLSVHENPDGQVLLKCQTGCSFEDVIGALGLRAAELFPPNPAYTGKNGPNGKRDEVARYDYTDEQGKPLFQKRRYLPKTFLLYRWENGAWVSKLNDNVRRVLYRLPEVMAAAKAGRIVFLVEGEKDADNLAALGFCATTNYEGASQDTQQPKWREDYSKALAGANLVIIPDNDDTGRAHTTNAARVSHPYVESVRILEMPGVPYKGDVSDWLANGGDADQLKKMVADTPPWAAGEPTISTIEPGKERRSALRSLAEILSDPAALNGPEEVVPRFAWRGRVTLLAGREKLGKSTLAGAAASAVSSGGRFIGQEVQAGPVLIVGLEEHVSDLASRLNDFGADPGRLFVLDTLSHGKPFEAIKEAVAEITEKAGAAPRLVVVDTLPRLAEGLVQESGSASQWSPVMSALTAIARTSNAALVLLHHARKSDGGYRDSTAVGAGVDAIIEMDQTPQDDECARKFRVKARWRTSDFSLRLIGTQYESVSGAVSPETKALFWVQANPGCSHREIREGVGGKATEVDAAVKRLLAQGLIRDGGTPQAHAYHPVSSDSTRDTLRDTPTVSQLTPLGPTTDTVGTTPRTQGCVPIPNPKAPSGTHPEAAPEGGEVWEVTT